MLSYYFVDSVIRHPSRACLHHAHLAHRGFHAEIPTERVLAAVELRRVPAAIFTNLAAQELRVFRGVRASDERVVVDVFDVPGPAFVRDLVAGDVEQRGVFQHAVSADVILRAAHVLTLHAAGRVEFAAFAEAFNDAATLSGSRMADGAPAEARRAPLVGLLDTHGPRRLVSHQDEIFKVPDRAALHAVVRIVAVFALEGEDVVEVPIEHVAFRAVVQVGPEYHRDARAVGRLGARSEG